MTNHMVYLLEANNERISLGTREGILCRTIAAGGVQPSNVKWAFYYDEAGNYHRVSHKGGAVPDGRSVSSDFILGGIVLRTRSRNNTLSRLHLHFLRHKAKSNPR